MASHEAAEKSALKPFEIVLYPDPRLLKPSRAITPAEIRSGEAEGLGLAQLSERMIVTMYDAEGVGLAAPQVGVGLRLFVADVSKDKTGAFTIINPVLSEMHGTVIEEEGCLSIPVVRAKVKRFASLKVSGLNLKGEAVIFDAKELLARVCQHETDHLAGVLFINKIGMAAKLMIRRALVELEDDFEQRRRDAVKNKKKI